MMTKSNDLQKAFEQEILNKAFRYCAYQPRCSSEIMQKLKDLGADTKLAEIIIKELQNADSYDDYSYAVSYATGKNRIKKWGKIKIFYELRKKGIQENIINDAVSEINIDEYCYILKDLAEKKLKETKRHEKKTQLQKTLYYLASKGYEKELSYNIINNLIKSIE